MSDNIDKQKIKKLIDEVNTENKQLFPILNYEKKYSISEDSLLIKNIIRNQFLKPTLGPMGYYYIGLYNGNVQKKFLVHRLVAMTFHKNPENKPFVDHIDGDKTNNHKDNLRWATASENMLNAQRNSKQKNNKTVNHVKPVIRINKDGTETVYKSATEAGKANNINMSAISKAISKPQYTAAGFSWKRTPEYKEYMAIVTKDEIMVNLGLFLEDFDNYTVSNNAAVFNISANKFMTPFLSGGYNMVNLSGSKSRKTISVHRLVAMCFCNPDKKDIDNLVVNHIDEDKLNNNYKNLEWVTVAQNTQHSVGTKVNRIDTETGDIETYNSITSAARSINMTSLTLITKCCNKQSLSAYGYKWEYAK